ARTGSIPLGSSRDDRPAGVDQSRAEEELGDLGQCEIHAAMSGAVPSVTVTVSRYLRLPWLTSRTAESWLCSHSPKRRTALVAVSEWKVTMSGWCTTRRIASR